MKVHCAGCQQQVEIAAPAAPRILNALGSSVLLVEHPYTGYCENCRKPVALQVMGANLIVCVVPVEPPPAESPIIIPGAIDASKLRTQ